MRSVIVSTGVSTTQGLTKELLEKFDVAIFDPTMANAQGQVYGEKIVNIPGLIEPAMRVESQKELISFLTQALRDGTAPFLERIRSTPNWNGYNLTLDWLGSTLLQGLGENILVLKVLDKLASQRRIAGILVHEDVTRMNRTIATWGKARDIPTVHVPHSNYFISEDNVPDVHQESITRYIAGTPHQKKWHEGRGYTGKVELTGSPLFDKWGEYKQDKEWAKRILKLDPNKPVVLYFSSWGQVTNIGDDRQRGMQALAEILSLQGDWQLAIKLHPGEGQAEQQYAQIAFNAGKRCLVSALYLEYMVNAADCVVTLGPSNMMVDAAILGVPAVCVQMPGYSAKYPAIKEVDLGYIGAAIEETLQDKQDWEKNVADFLYETTYGAIGKANSNIATWLKELW